MIKFTYFPEREYKLESLIDALSFSEKKWTNNLDKITLLRFEDVEELTHRMYKKCGFCYNLDSYEDLETNIEVGNCGDVCPVGEYCRENFSLIKTTEQEFLNGEIDLHELVVEYKKIAKSALAYLAYIRGKRLL